MGRDDGWVKGDSLQPNMVVSAMDNCWPVCMHSGMGSAVKNGHGPSSAHLYVTLLH